MSLQFDAVRGKNHPTVVTAMQDWVAATPVGEIEDVTVHRDANGHTVYSVFYWEADR